MWIVLCKIIEVKKVLVINASARVLHSHSRTLTDVFIEHWKNRHQEAEISFS